MNYKNQAIICKKEELKTNAGKEKNMLKQETFFQSDKEGQEIFPADYEEFPFLCWTRNLTDQNYYIGGCIPWHWHSALEIGYLMEGEMELETSSGIFPVRRGDWYFINTEVVHEMRAKKGISECRHCALLFDAQLLAGAFGSRMERKYLLPVTANGSLSEAVFRPDSYSRIKMAESILRVMEAVQKEEPGYEFEIRSELSRFWMLLLEETKAQRTGQGAASGIDAVRLKQMIQFIQTHYPDRITAEEIASAASISVRECSRCFARSIRKSPVSYLNDYRLRMAAGKLLKTDAGILDISEDCGFRSASYFSKAFRDSFGCTPGEYRKNRGEIS